MIYHSKELERFHEDNILFQVTEEETETYKKTN
jgi:hypothetical protein